MAFYNLAFKLGVITVDQLRLFVKTEDNPKGQITREEFEKITKEDFDVIG